MQALKTAGLRLLPSGLKLQGPKLAQPVEVFCGFGPPQQNFSDTASPHKVPSDMRQMLMEGRGPQEWEAATVALRKLKVPLIPSLWDSKGVPTTGAYIGPI